MATVAKVIKELKEVKGHVAVVVWTRDDVLTKAEELGINCLTDEDADNIIDSIDKNCDPELCISWITLSVYIHEYLKQKDVAECIKDDTRD